MDYDSIASLEIAALDSWNNLKQVESFTKSPRRQTIAENVVIRGQEKTKTEQSVSLNRTKRNKDWQNLPKLFYFIIYEINGDPYGTRTRVFAVKGRCPRPLDEGVSQRNVYWCTSAGSSG